MLAEETREQSIHRWNNKFGSLLSQSQAAQDQASQWVELGENPTLDPETPKSVSQGQWGCSSPTAGCREEKHITKCEERRSKSNTEDTIHLEQESQWSSRIQSDVESHTSEDYQTEES